MPLIGGSGLGSVISASTALAVTAWDFSSLAPSSWFDFNDSLTIQKTGTNLIQANSKIQSSSTVAAPTNNVSLGNQLNGLQVAAFNSSYLTLSSAALTTSVFIVFDVLTGSNQRTDVSPLIGADVVSEYFFVLTNSTAYTLSLDGNVPYNNGAASFNGAPLSTGQNIDMGISIAQKAASNVLYAQVARPFSTLRIGSFDNGANSNSFFALKGRIGEVLTFPGALAQSDIDKGFGRLNHKWGLANLLPTGHPYKSAPPTS